MRAIVLLIWLAGLSGFTLLLQLRYLRKAAASTHPVQAVSGSVANPERSLRPRVALLNADFPVQDKQSDLPSKGESAAVFLKKGRSDNKGQGGGEGVDPGGTVVKVVCDSTKGTFVIEVHPSWSPIGAERFLEK